MYDTRAIEFAQFGVTNFHPIALVFMAIMTVLTFSRSRSTAILAVLLVCVFMPEQQRVVVVGLDFSMLRLIMISAWIRVLVKGEHRGVRFGRLDRVFILWMIAASLFYLLRIGPSGIVYRLGVSFDALTAYFLIRVLVRTNTDVLMLWRHVASTTVVLSAFMLYEWVSLHNVFGMFNYAGFDPVEVRDGQPRAAGPFAHPILAGTFGAAALPLFMGVFMGRRSQRLFYGVACIAATVTVLTAGSSGAALAWLFAVFGWAIWRLRRHMKVILWGVFFMAVVIHFIREQPVWHLIGRLTSIVGGTGYHRTRLIDAFIRRFGEWALVGTDNTAHWGWGLQDTTNQYVSEGISGGLVTLVLFIVLLKVCFVQLKATRNVFERVRGPKSLWALLAWGSSVSLAAHCLSFISVSYFGQIFQFFVFFIATIPGLAKFKRPRGAATRTARASTSAPIAATRFQSESPR